MDIPISCVELLIVQESISTDIVVSHSNNDSTGHTCVYLQLAILRIVLTRNTP